VHDGPGLSRLAQDVATSWQGVAKPVFAACSMEELMNRVHEAHEDPHARRSVFALIDCSKIATEREIDRMLHVLADGGCAGVAVVHASLFEHCMRATHAAHHGDRQGLLIRAASTPAPVIGAMLQALVEREHAIEALRSELALMHRAHERSLHEVQKLHEELHLAAGLQRELAATQVPATAGLDLGVLHRPVSTVSGDVHCVREIAPGKVAFFVADAVGHGVPAALMTMVLLSGLATHMHEGAAKDFAPAKVLESLNRKLLSYGFGCDRFATAVCGIVDVATGIVKLAGAGHPPPVIIGKGNTRVLETDGPLLGVFDEAEFQETQAMLSHHDRLLVYSDGLEGALPRAGTSLMHQLAPLEETMRASEDLSGEGVIAAVAELLDGQAGSLHQLDDVTVVAMRIVAPRLAVAA
jgi:sigma-B regulation protein RsbU (phosphoserine phosphatase)